MAELKAIQSGTAVMTGDNLDVTITSVDTTKAFLLFNYRIDGDGPSIGQVRGRLQNATNVRFERHSTTNTVTIEWQVIEFTSGVTVQRGNTTMNSGTKTETVTSVDTSKTFVIVSHNNSGTGTGVDDFTHGRMTSNNQLTLRITNSASAAIASWQVVEYDNADVQTIVHQFTSGTTDTQTITSVDLTKTVLFTTGRLLGGGGINFSDLVNVRLSNATTLAYERYGTSEDFELVTHVIELTDDVTVQRFYPTISSASASGSQTISSVNTDNSIVWGGSEEGTFSSADTSNDLYGRACFTQALTGSTTLSWARATSGSAAKVVMEVMEYTAGQEISPNGIVSAEAWGSPSLSVGNVNVNPNGIASEEAFGNATLVPGGVSVSLDGQGIPSAEAFGVPSVQPGTITITPSGIASQEAFGSPSLSVGGVTVDLDGTGITSEEAFGQPSIVPGGVSIGLNGFGIATEEAFGLVNIIGGGIVDLSGEGIPSAEAWGQPSLTTGGVTVQVLSIDSGEAFGTPTVQPGSVTVQPVSIISSEAWGQPNIAVGNVNIQPVGIDSGEAWGLPKITGAIKPDSILSAEAWGQPTISTGNVDIEAIGIESGEAWGQPSVVFGLLVFPNGIESAEAWGQPRVVLKVLNEFHQMMETDLDETFFNNIEFAIDAVYEHKSGKTFDIVVIYDRPYVSVDPGTGAEFISTDPQVMCKTNQFTEAIKRGDKMVIHGERFQVITDEPDGTGVTTITLHREKTV